jgi:type VI secretion system protein VasD
MFVVGCAASSPPSPTPISGTVSADGAVNPDIVGRPSPVAVKIYQLRTAGGFQSADFFGLYSNATAVLGPDLIASRDVVVRPGESTRFDEEIDPRTRFVGIVAGFRDVQNARWRAVVPVPAKGLADHVLEVRLNNLAAEASFVEPN